MDITGEPAFRTAVRKLDECLAASGGRQVLAAIDGQAASGKTTLGEALKAHYGCALFHMDDFYLQNVQRTPERFAQPGGNVDRERFKEEVLDHAADPQGLWFRRFDCATRSLCHPEYVPFHRLVIVEGAYSQHPYFGDIYDLRFYFGIDPEEQRRRILKRNGPEKLRMFEERWIPWENRYLETFGIREKSIVLG